MHDSPGGEPITSRPNTSAQADGLIGEIWRVGRRLLEATETVKALDDELLAADEASIDGEVEDRDCSRLRAQRDAAITAWDDGFSLLGDAVDRLIYQHGKRPGPLIDALEALRILDDVTLNLDGGPGADGEIASLVDYLYEGNDDRISICATLGEIGDQRAVSSLARLFSYTPNERVARSAAFAIGEIGGMLSAQALVARLGVGEADRADAVYKSLVRMGPCVIEPVINKVRNGSDTRAGYDYARWVLRDLGLEALVRALRDTDVRVRHVAAWEFKRTLEKSVVAPLVEACADVDLDVRRGIARALGVLCGPEVADALIRLLADADEDVRKTGARARDSWSASLSPTLQRHTAQLAGNGPPRPIITGEPPHQASVHYH